MLNQYFPDDDERILASSVARLVLEIAMQCFQQIMLYFIVSHRVKWIGLPVSRFTFVFVFVFHCIALRQVDRSAC